MKTIKRYYSIFPAIIFALAIFIASAQSHIDLPNLGFAFNDKIYHAFAYFIFGLTILLALDKNSKTLTTKELIIYMLCIGCLYAASDEYHQSFVWGRTADFFDWVADSIGIILSIPIYFKYLQKFTEKIFK